MTASYKLGQLILIEGFDQTDLLEVLLDASLTGLQSYTRGRNSLKFTADYRLAFRELGLSIGLHAIEKLVGLIKQAPYDFNMKQRLHSRTEP